MRPVEWRLNEKTSQRTFQGKHQGKQALRKFYTALFGYLINSIDTLNDKGKTDLHTDEF
jgi:hypothetical protein